MGTHLGRYEIFLKVAETGSITRAARLLNYSQAGVSHAVAAMEAEAGASLFVRAASGVTLTENGRALLPSVQRLVNDKRELERTIGTINGVVAGTLRVGTFTSVSVHWLPRVIAAFTAEYPQVEFELIAGDYNQGADRLTHGRTDCAFLTAPTPPDLEFVPLYDDPMLLLLPQDHPLTKRERVPLSALEGEPLVLPAEGADKDAREALRAGGDAGTGRQLEGEVRYKLNDDFSVMAMVAGGYGLTVMPELITRGIDLGFVSRPLEPAYHRTIGIAVPKGARASRLARTFAKFLAQNRETLCR